jgi:hypothetical protein
MVRFRKPVQGPRRRSAPKWAKRRSAKSSQVKRPWIKRPLVWLGAFVTAVITGVVTTLVAEYGKEATGIGQAGPTPAKTTARTGPPLTVAYTNITSGRGGDSFAFSRPLDVNESQLKAIQVAGDQSQVHRDEYLRWASANGGVIADEAGTAIIQLTMQGNRAGQVRILDMQPLVQCNTPLTGTLFYSPPAGEGKTAKLGFELDKPNHVARTYSQERGLGGSYFVDKTISLARDEQQVFSIYVVTKRYCEFRLRLKLLDGSKTIFETVGNGAGVDGRALPFKITAMNVRDDFVGPGAFSAYKRMYAGGVTTSICANGGGWIKTDSGNIPRAPC